LNLNISILQYVKEITTGNITCEEFVAKTFDQIKKNDQNLHAYLSLNDHALEQAHLIDNKIKMQYLPPFLLMDQFVQCY